MKKIVALALCLIMALSLATVAMAASSTVVYYAPTTGELNATNSVEIYDDAIGYVKALAPDTDDDGVTTKGHVAYYTVSVIAGKYYEAVGTLAEADIAVATDDAMENVYMYLKEIKHEYVAGAVFTNFGKACGQYKDANLDTTKTYYAAEYGGTDYLFKGVSKVADADMSLKVADKMVLVEQIGALNTKTVKHTATPVVANGKTTGYVCSACKLAAVEAANAASVPTNADRTGLVGNWYWPASTATTTTGVSSAKTFDAGVALYAGMALMSVAGSAVVIGKKKEF